MRPIRFIGIDENNKRYELKGINWENMTGLCEVEGVMGWTWNRFEHFVQFTGLHDKNGKEIYEGDVVLDHGEYEMGTIKHVISVPYLEDRDGYKKKNFEVIGNIYENPELVGAK